MNGPAEYHDPTTASLESSERHRRRYLRAIGLLKRVNLPRGPIMDVACGTGYGTALLSDSFEDVVGVDRSVIAIGKAAERAPAGLSFRSYEIAEACEWLPTYKPAAVVCIETLEHLGEIQQAGWIGDVAEALRPGGALVLMCPVKHRGEKSGPNPRNAWHLHEPTVTEVLELLEPFHLLHLDVEPYQSTAGEEAWQLTALAISP